MIDKERQNELINIIYTSSNTEEVKDAYKELNEIQKVSN